MSATLIPTKTAGERPPILPPVTTTFDGASGDDGDSALDWMRDNVRSAIRHADAASGDKIEGALAALRLRRNWVNADLDGMRMLFDYPIPSVEGFSMDYLLNRGGRVETALLNLLGQLDEAIARSERRLARHRFEVRLLDDLGASDS